MTQQTALNTRTDWLIELTYIQSIRASAPGASFNNSRACFGRYCVMQIARAEKAGFQDIADDILLHVLSAPL